MSVHPMDVQYTSERAQTGNETVLFGAQVPMFIEFRLRETVQKHPGAYNDALDT